MVADLILYTNPMSRGRIARWMLEEVGAPYEAVLLDYAKSMKAPDYLAINPMGKVPALVHAGRVVTECAAICAYLADAFPDANLGPETEERAAYYRWLFFAAGPLEQAVTNHVAKFEPDAKQSASFGYGTYDHTVNVVEQVLATQPYIAGERFTAADVYFGSAIGWGVRFGTLPSRPAFTAYWDRVSARPAFQKADAIDEALMAAAK